MKKFGIALASILLAGSLAAFAGCGESGGDDTGKVSGNFKEEKDPAKAAETVQSIDFSKAFGDMSKSDWALGLKATEKISVNLDLSVVGMSSGAVSATAEAAPAVQKIQGDLVYEGSELVNLTHTAMLAQAEMSMKLKEKGENKEKSMSAKSYVDGSYVYASAEADGEDPMKVKVSLKDIMSAVGNIGGIGGLPMLEEDEEVGYTQYVQQAIATIYQLGGKLSFDQKDGLKVKATFGDEFFANALSMASLVADTEVKAVISGISFTKNSSVEAAVAFDANGLFTEFGLNVDFGVKLDATKLGVVGGSVNVSGGVKIETTSEAVTLPAGLATDTSYEEVDIKDLLPGDDVSKDSSLVGEWQFYSIIDEMNDTVYYVGDALATEDSKYIYNSNTYTLTVRDDGTFTMTTELSEDPEYASISGNWIDNQDGTYTLTPANGKPSANVVYEGGYIIFGSVLTLTR